MGHERFDGAVALVGGGTMGEAIISGLLAAGAVEPGQVRVAEPVEARRAELLSRFAVSVFASGADACADARVVILAVKPQLIDTVVSQLADAVAGSVVVSIAAGISTARLEALLPAGTPVVRVMPNTPAVVGRGMALISRGTEASDDQVELIAGLFRTVGEVVVLEERFQDAGTAISGSGPAYFALFVDALARAGVAQGLPRATAQLLAVETMYGTAEMLSRTGLHPEQLIDGVSSPGGTTIAALHVLESRGVRAAIGDAVSAAVTRSRELGAG